jgi:hypothetical protein
MLPAVAVKVVVANPARTVADLRTGSSGLLLARATVVPPAGAALLRLTVQVALAPEIKLVGVQDNEDNTTGATKLIVAVCDAPFRVAVSVAL